MRNNFLLCCTFASLFGASLAMAADDSVQAAKVAKPDDIRVQLAKKLPGTKPEDIRATPISGLYEIAAGSTSAFITADGKYSIYNGDLYELSTKTNLSENRRIESRMQALAGLKETDTIVFGGAAAPKHTITVFFDVDCGYCRKLHGEVAELNRLGIRVRYTAFPRSGPGTPSWEKMEKVWCAKNRQEALTKVQLDQDIGSATCGVTPVASQYKLGEELGVNGTPAIFTEGGDYIGGYLPPQQLLAHLEELKARAASKKGGS